MTDVVFVDTTLRDGQQSLWAYNMRTGMIVPIVEYIDAAGFDNNTGWGLVQAKAAIAELTK